MHHRICGLGVCCLRLMKIPEAFCARSLYRFCPSCCPWDVSWAELVWAGDKSPRWPQFPHLIDWRRPQSARPSMQCTWPSVIGPAIIVSPFCHAKHGVAGLQSAGDCRAHLAGLCPCCDVTEHPWPQWSRVSLQHPTPDQALAVVGTSVSCPSMSLRENRRPRKGKRPGGAACGRPARIPNVFMDVGPQAMSLAAGTYGLGWAGLG